MQSIFYYLKEYPFPYNIINFVKYMPRHIKSFWQRGMRGYSDCDLWNIDEYVSEVMIGVLTQFKEHHAGYPSTISDKKWTSILGEIIEGFKAHQAFDDDDMIKNGEYNREKSDALIKKFNRGMRLLSKWYFNLWD